MAGGVYKIDTNKLDPNSIELLQGLGVSTSQITKGEIEIDSLPPETRKIAEGLFNKMGFNALSLHDNRTYRRFGDFSGFIMNSDGKADDFSAKDKELLSDLYQNGLEFEIRDPIEASPNFDKASLEKIGVKSVKSPDGGFVVYVFDAQRFNDFQIYLATEAKGKIDTSGLIELVSAHLEDYITYREKLTEDLNNTPKTKTVTDIETCLSRFSNEQTASFMQFLQDEASSRKYIITESSYLKYLTTHDLRVFNLDALDMLHKTLLPKKALGEEEIRLAEEIKENKSAVEQDRELTMLGILYKCGRISGESYDRYSILRDPRLLEPEEVRALAYALDLDKLFGIRDEKDIEEISKKYAEPELRAALHYFVDPKKYPRPEQTDVLFPGESSIIWREPIHPQGSAIPKPASGALQSARSLSVLLGDRIKKGYLTCVGQKKIDQRTYVIYAAAEHNLDQIRSLYPEATRTIDDKVVLTAFTLDHGQTPPKVVEIAARAKPLEGFIYTVRGLGSDPRYTDGFNEEGQTTTYRDASPDLDKYMLFRGLNKRGDSGSPVVDDKGRLVGILLAGDNMGTIAAYADMDTLKKALKIFIEGLE